MIKRIGLIGGYILALPIAIYWMIKYGIEGASKKAAVINARMDKKRGRLESERVELERLRKALESRYYGVNHN